MDLNLRAWWYHIGCHLEFLTENFCQLRIPSHKVRARRTAITAQLKLQDFHSRIHLGRFTVEEASEASIFLDTLTKLYDELADYQSTLPGDYPIDKFNAFCYQDAPPAYRAEQPPLQQPPQQQQQWRARVRGEPDGHPAPNSEP
jgi:hypothetical protein